MTFNEIRSLIAEGELSRAIEELRIVIEESGSPSREEIFLQSFRLKDKIKDLRKGVVSQNETDVLKAKVSQSILQMLNDLEEFENADIKNENEKKNSITNYYISGDMVKGDTYKAKKITINRK